MKTLAYTFLAVFLVWSFHGVVVAEPETGKKGEVIQDAGCVSAGVEAGCLILESFENKKLYNLFFPDGKKPAVGNAISFEGVAHDGPTTCMQGTPVDVTKWTLLKRLCPKASSGGAMATEERILVEIREVTLRKVKENLFRITAKGVVRTTGWVVNLHPMVYIRPPENWDMDAVGIKPTGPVGQVISPWEASIEMNLSQETRHITVHGMSLSGEKQAITKGIPW
jgi:hypothetical protein